MNSDQLDDLKQFIDGKFSQFHTLFTEEFDQKLAASEKRLTNKIEGVRSEVHGLRDEMRAGFAGVADVIEENSIDIDRRLAKLEQQVFPS